MVALQCLTAWPQARRCTYCAQAAGLDLATSRCLGTWGLEAYIYIYIYALNKLYMHVAVQLCTALHVQTECLLQHANSTHDIACLLLLLRELQPARSAYTGSACPDVVSRIVNLA